MIKIIVVVAAMAMGTATGFASEANILPNNDLVVSNLVVMVEKEMAPCTDRGNKKPDQCTAVTTAIDKHIIAAAKQDQDKYWDLLAETNKVFHHRAEALMHELKASPRAETTEAIKVKSKKFDSWFKARMASIKLRTLFMEKTAKMQRDLLKEIDESNAKRSQAMKILLGSSSDTR